MPPLMLLIVGGLVLAGGIAVVLLSSRGDGQAEPGGLLALHRNGDGAAGERGRQDDPDPSPLLSRLLDRVGATRKLQWRLLQAGLLVRPSELMVLVLGLAGGGFIVGMVVRGPLLAMAMAAVAGWLPFVWIGARHQKRSKALIDQLAEALAMMASSLRSGYSFMRAMQVVRDEMDPPISEEFGRVLDELNVGVSHERALRHLLERCPQGDIELVVTACQIQATVGGNLAEILDTTAGMIRERVRLQGEISALTAEGRLSASILIALPVLLGLIVNHLSPGYLTPLIQTHIGMMLSIGACSGMLMGMLVIRKMLQVQI
jgi:tight adherence protein B